MVPDPRWAGSEEDHAFRSHVIQWLLHHEGPQSARPGCDFPIPRTLVQYWHDLNALPDDVAKCLNSWKQLENSGFELRLFDDEEARHFIAANYDARHLDAFDLCYHPAMRCDYFRLSYMLKNGGVYVDADEVYRGSGFEALLRNGILKVQPLCYDLSTEQMVEPSDFLNDTRCPSSRIFYVNNNPIVSPPGHSLLVKAFRRATDILLRSGSEKPEIQSTTGPGNLSASLVRHVADLRRENGTWDFEILRDWESMSECQWFLSYRNDERNWRLARRVSAGE